MDGRDYVLPEDIKEIAERRVESSNNFELWGRKQMESNTRNLVKILWKSPIQ